MPTKVLHIITGLRQGGAEKILLDICSSKPEYNIVVSLGSKDYYFEKFISRNIRTYCLNISFLNPLSILNLISLFIIYIKFKPKVVQTWLYHADLIGSLLSILFPYHELIWTVVHADISFKRNKSTTYLIIRILSLLSHLLPKKIIYNAYSARKNHEAINYCKSKSLTIHTGIDIKLFKPIEEIRKKRFKYYNLDPETLVLGSIARFHPIKNQELIFKSMNRAISKINRPIHLLMAGEKIYCNNKELIGMLEKNNIRNHVTMLGPIAKIYEIMNCLDFLILSSYSEACPNVLLEASLCGIPAISTDVGDANYLIGKFGFIVESNNVSQMSNAIIKGSKMTEKEHHKLSLATLERSLSKFTKDKMLSAYNKFY